MLNMWCGGNEMKRKKKEKKNDPRGSGRHNFSRVRSTTVQ